MSTNHVENLPGMIGRHPLMLEVYRRVRKVAPTELPILIVGETGTGKELVARAVHELSARAGQSFEAVNCAAIPESLAEAELFGAEPGAFTGAVRRREGVLGRAHGTTLFLDEVCSMRLDVQAKLLRAIEQQEFTRLGGDAPVCAHVRLIAGASRPPEELLAGGVLRRDLFHRLAVGRLTLPPLMERGDDIVLLADHFLRSTGKQLAPDAQRFLREYAWPGNVRELRSAIDSVVVLVEGRELTRAHLAAELDGGRLPVDERERLVALLDRHAWNVSAAAREAGRSRTTLYGWMRAYRVARPVPLPGRTVQH